MGQPHKMPEAVRSLVFGLAALLLVAHLAGCGRGLAGARTGLELPKPRVLMTADEYARWARKEFDRNHPGEKPLNWAIAQAALDFHASQPMGKFVLSVTPGEPGNDCSDFVECAVDEGLGAGARFNRDSEEHIYGRSRDLWDGFEWRPGTAVQPGDIVRVRHSPWYAPNEDSCWHVGLLGSDAMVYDFTKLKRWPRARYGRNEFDWFVRHCADPGEVVVLRLRAEFRYLITELPDPGSAPRETPAGGR